MSDLDALLAGIVAHPHEYVRWLIVADWLDDHGFAARAELLRLHRMLIDTCCEPDAHPERAAWQARIVELIDRGVTPCVPQHTLMLPGDVPLVGNFIPPGSFLMGGEVEDEEKPVHQVTLTRGFWLGTAPVTQAQWQAVMGTNPSHFKGGGLPVEMASWEDAMSFCGRSAELTGVAIRLPTEAEWEYAVRAGTVTRYHWSDVPDAGRLNGSGDGIDSLTGLPEGKHWGMTAAGTFAPNPWGLWDGHGNVYEWCADQYDGDFYERSPETDPVCQDSPSTVRVVRGGSWLSDLLNCRVSRRVGLESNYIHRGFGFRIAFTLG